MEDFKIEYFKTDHPDREFPVFHHLIDIEAKDLFHRLKERFSLDVEGNAEALLNVILHESEEQLKIDDPAAFVLSEMLATHGISADMIYINWYKFDDIDIMNIETIDRFFEYVWYKGPDDIELFDATFDWFILINHEGYVKMFNL
jgi:hypothetical protein